MNVETKRKRKFFLGANWKCNGTTAFCKDIVENMINDFEYDDSKLGKEILISNKAYRFDGDAWNLAFILGTSNCQ